VVVRVEGQGDLAVAERLHHHAGRDALIQKERGAGVAEIVEPLVRQTFLSENGLEPAGDRDPSIGVRTVVANTRPRSPIRHRAPARSRSRRWRRR
jgi:hypothetical protein